MAFSTPVLFLVFNRPEHTNQVFQQIRRIRPTQLFVSADGPRKTVAGEAEKCAAVRAVIDQVDWDCTVHTNFLPENHGCRKAVTTGISWFFQHVEEGIILEDDCLPDESFFTYCASLLEKYRDDEDVWHISGSNPCAWQMQRMASSYVFSRFPFIWGWATWRRSWLQYDPFFSGLDESWLDAGSGFSAISASTTARLYLYDKFASTRNGEIDTWDYAWFYTILKNKGACLNPTSNLVRNIGFDQEATHTRKRFLGPVPQSKTGTMMASMTDPAGRQPNYALERTFFQRSQKGDLGLVLRYLAPHFFFKHMPPPKPWINLFGMKTFFTS
ncbi:MAG: hypothetical protein H6574_06235 [Lewinellaceae bacterium]|nr:hypothetical protein [Saprospiraceae bacterium]MCB9316383.1 hypothetical protein [Lewinellaceae bacterium]MCB9330661.1 hypothetical protein [Lewinellaceae bacterium]